MMIKRLQVITTDENRGRSACEALWYEMAEQALDSNHSLSINVSRNSAGCCNLEGLSERGAKVSYRIPAPKKGRIMPVLYKAWQRSCARWEASRMLDADSDFILLNVGTLVEVVREPWASLLEASDLPYGIIVHNNPEIRHYPRDIADRLRQLLLKASKVYFVSERLWSNAEEQLLCRISSGGVVRNPVNLTAYHAEPWPSEANGLHMAVVGRLDAFIKGQIRLLHALSSGKWKAREWKLTFYGAGPDEARIREAVSFYGLEERVELGGFVTSVREDIWAKNHVLVMPSMLEGMPLALVEAMICGRPAVCSDVGGASELVRDGRNGFMAGSPFYSQLVEVLESLWEARKQLQRLGAAAHMDATAFVSKSPGEDLLNDICDLLN